MDEKFQNHPPIFQDFLDKLSALEKYLISWQKRVGWEPFLKKGFSKVNTFEFSQHVLLLIAILALGFMPNFNQHFANVSWRVIGQFAYL